MADTGGSHDYNDEQLTRYLLGTLDADDAEAFDELSITDQEFAARLLVAEDDLVDAFARGDLDADSRSRFESRYLSVPGAREKLRFAETLAARQSRSGSAGPGIMVGSSHVSRPRWRPMWALAAAASLVLAAASYIVIERATGRSSQPQVPTTVVRSQPGPPEAAPSRPAPTESVIAMVLVPPTRAPRELPTLTLPGDAARVQISLVLESDDYRSYQVVLKQSEADRTLWQSARLSSSASGANRILPVTIDAAVLTPGRHTLELSGYGDAGGGEVITSYTFRVIR